MGLFYGEVMLIKKLVFEYQNDRFQFNLVGRMHDKALKLVNDFRTANPELENYRLEFGKALLLGKIEGCKIVEIEVEKPTHGRNE